VSSPNEHFAKNVFFACIDDRLVGAFYAAVAGGGLAFVNPTDQNTALKQVTAAYTINHITDVYLESHTSCGAYKLSGVEFSNPAEELERLYADLDKASELVLSALHHAGAAEGEIRIHARVVSPDGTEQPRAIASASLPKNRLSRP
jgi:carbonic anhydrase